MDTKTNQVIINIMSKTKGNISDLSQTFIDDQKSLSYKFKDVEFICKDGILYGHRSILMGYCKFFEIIFTEEKNEPMSIIYLPEFEIKYFSLVLSSFYSGGMILNSSDIPEITIILEHLGIIVEESCTIKCYKTEDLGFSRQELRIIDIKNDEEKFNYISEFHTYLNSKAQRQKENICREKSGPLSSKGDQVSRQKQTKNINEDNSSSTLQTDSTNTRILSTPTATKLNTPINDDSNFDVPMPKLSPQLPRYTTFKCLICQKIGSSYKEFNEHLNKEECGKSLLGKFTYNELIKKCHICSYNFEKIDGDVFMKHVKLCDEKITIKREIIEEREKISVSSSESESSSSSSSESDDEDALIPVLRPVKKPTPNVDKECIIILPKLPQDITDEYKEQLLCLKTRQVNPPLDLDSDNDNINRRRTRSSNKEKRDTEVISLVSDSDSENDEVYSMQEFILTKRPGPLSYKLFTCQICSIKQKNIQALSDCLTRHNKIKCYVCLEIVHIDILERHMKKKHKSQDGTELIECPHCQFPSQWQNMNKHIIVSHYKGKTENKNYKSSTNNRNIKSSKKKENDPKTKTNDSSLASLPKKNIYENKVNRNESNSNSSILSSTSKLSKRPTTTASQVMSVDKIPRLSENINNQASNITQTSSSILTTPNISNEYLKRPSKKTTSAFLLANKLPQASTASKKRNSSSSLDLLIENKAKFRRSTSSSSTTSRSFCDFSPKPNSQSLLSFSPLDARINCIQASGPNQLIQKNVNEMEANELHPTFEGASDGNDSSEQISVRVNDRVYRIVRTKKVKDQMPSNPSQLLTNIHKDGEGTSHGVSLDPTISTTSINYQALTEPPVTNINEKRSSNETSSNAVNHDTQQGQSQVAESSVLLEISGNKLNNTNNSTTVQAFDNDNDNTALTNNSSLDVNQIDSSFEMIQSLLDSDSNDDVSYRSRANYKCDKCKEIFLNKSNYDSHNSCI